MCSNLLVFDISNILPHQFCHLKPNIVYSTLHSHDGTQRYSSFVHLLGGRGGKGRQYLGVPGALSKGVLKFTMSVQYLHHAVPLRSSAPAKKPYRSLSTEARMELLKRFYIFCDDFLQGHDIFFLSSSPFTGLTADRHHLKSVNFFPFVT